MSFAKSPLRRGRYGRAVHTRFVEVEMPPVAASHLVVELDGGGRILLSEPAHVAWVAQLLISIAGHHAVQIDDFIALPLVAEVRRDEMDSFAEDGQLQLRHDPG